MKYEIVDNYARQEHFDFFSSFRNPFYGLSMQLDITAAKAYAAERGASIYLLLCYLVTRAAHRIEDFHYRVREGRIVRYERLDISATVPAPGGLFSFAFLDFDPDVERFLECAPEQARRAGERVSLAEREHFNQLLFTALPKVPFSHFTHAGRSDHLDARPNVAFGRFDCTGERLLAPVGLEVNHIFIDGVALGELVEGIQRELDHPGGSS